MTDPIGEARRRDLTRTAVALIAASQRNDTTAIAELISSTDDDLGGELVATLAALLVIVHDSLRAQLAEEGVLIGELADVIEQMRLNAA